MGDQGIADLPDVVLVSAVAGAEPLLWRRTVIACRAVLLGYIAMTTACVLRARSVGGMRMAALVLTRGP